MDLLYFAWMRERIGKSDETINIPDDVTTVAELIGYLRKRGDGYKSAFENETSIRVAIDQEYASMDASVANAREVAFFPPVTGG